MLRVVVDDDASAELHAGLDEIVREGARRMLIATIEAEADGYIEALAGELDEKGHRLVVRNGHAVARTITTAAGGIEIRRPGWTTAGSTPRPLSGAGSPRSSCRRGAARARRWPRCCH